MAKFLLTSAFVLGAVPAHALALIYGLRTNWFRTGAGRVLFALFAVTVVSYDLSLLALFWPATFGTAAAGPGLWVRVGGRFAIAIVLGWMLWLLLRVQRRSVPAHTGRNAPGRSDGPLMSLIDRSTPASAPVEIKVAAAAAGGGLIGVVLAVLSVAGDPTNAALLGDLPPWVRFLLLVLGPAVVPGVAAYLAPHTPRPVDVPAELAAVNPVPPSFGDDQ